MKRGQEYTDYINASFIDVSKQHFHAFPFKIRDFAAADSSFKEAQSSWLAKHMSFVYGSFQMHFLSGVFNFSLNGCPI